MVNIEQNIEAAIAADRGQGTVAPSTKGIGFDIRYSNGTTAWASTEEFANIAARPCFTAETVAAMSTADKRRVFGKEPMTMPNMTDYDRLRSEYHRLGNELDAAHDGALHHAYGAAADRMVAAIERKYAAARTAFLSTRSEVTE